MPQPDIGKKYPTRSKGGYIPFKYENKIFNTSFFPNTLKLWNNLPKQIQIKDVKEFKICVKTTFCEKNFPNSSNLKSEGKHLRTSTQQSQCLLLSIH